MSKFMYCAFIKISIPYFVCGRNDIYVCLKHIKWKVEIVKYRYDSLTSPNMTTVSTQTYITRV